jgi:hypothetical protein
LSGRAVPAGSPETSFENLIACDPPNIDHAHSCREFLKKKMFDFDAVQFEVLSQQLKPLI